MGGPRGFLGHTKGCPWASWWPGFWPVGSLVAGTGFMGFLVARNGLSSMGFGVHRNSLQPEKLSGTSHGHHHLMTPWPAREIPTHPRWNHRDPSRSTGNPSNWLLKAGCPMDPFLGRIPADPVGLIPFLANRKPAHQVPCNKSSGETRPLPPEIPQP